MKCSDIRNNFSDYIDGEALPEVAAAIEQHVTGCDECRRELENYRAFTALLSGLGEEELPFAFNAKLRQRLEEEARARRRGKAVKKRGWVKAVALAAACLVLVVGAASVGGRLLLGKGANDAAPAEGYYGESGVALYDYGGGSSGMTAARAPQTAAEAPQAAPEAEMFAEEAQEYSAADNVAGVDPKSVPQEALERKIIRNCSLSLKVNDFDAAFAAIEACAATYGGYVVSGEKYDYEGSTQRSGFISIRVDSERLDEALAEIEGLGAAESSNFYTSDVTADYYDIQGRLKQYRTQEQRLTELYDQAEAITDMIAIEAELSRVSAEIDSLEGTLRYYDQLTALSLINVNLYTPDTYTQVVEPQGWAGFWQDIREGFLNGINSALDFLAGLFVLIVSIFPSLVLVAVAVLVVALVIRGLRKRKRGGEKQ